MNYKHILSISILIIAISIAYYLVIHIPNKERITDQTRIQHVELKTNSNSLRVKQLDSCLEEAEDEYNSSWISNCKGVGAFNNSFFQSLTIVDEDPNREWKTMSNGKIYSAEGEWVFDEARGDWLPNMEIVRDCKLNNATVKILENKYKEGKDFCFQRYPQRE